MMETPTHATIVKRSASRGHNASLFHSMERYSTYDRTSSMKADLKTPSSYPVTSKVAEISLNERPPSRTAKNDGLSHSGIAIPAIVSCVTAIISAYRDAARIAIYMQVRREQVHARMPHKYDELEASLEGAPRDIEVENGRIAERCECTLPQGNEHIYVTLLNIQWELQRTLLDKLRTVSDDDHVVSVEDLVNASDLARAKVIGALCELQQKLLEIPRTASTSIPIKPAIAVALTGDRKQSYESSRPEQKTLLSEAPPIAISTPVKRLITEPARPSLEGPRPRNGAIMKRTHMAVSNTENAFMEPDQINVRKNPKSVPLLEAAQAGNDWPLRGGDVVTYCYANVEPKKKWYILKWGQLRKDLNEDDLSRRDSVTGRSSPFDLTANRRNFDRPATEPRVSFSAMTIDSSLSRSSSRPSHSRNKASINSFATTITPYPGQSRFPLPTKENDYLGFCKGAWKIDVTARARRRGEAVVERYIPCPTGRCNFAASVFPPKVVAPKSGVMKLRWAFLARSHMRQTDMRSGDYSYRCIICILSGLQSEPYRGINPFLEHIATHAEDELDEDMLHRIQCVTGRVADDTESFALNLFPPDAQSFFIDETQSQYST